MDEIAVREGIAVNLGVLQDTQVSPWLLGAPTPPTAHVFAGPVEFDAAFGRGLDMLVITVQVLVPALSDIGSQQKLALYRAGSGSQSVKAAIESDRTLGGVSQTLRVTGMGAEQLFAFEGRGPFLGSEWRVEVHAHG